MFYPAERSGFCKHCRRRVLVREYRLGSFHGVMTVLTCGLWSPILLLAALFQASKGMYVCTRCGSRTR